MKYEFVAGDEIKIAPGRTVKRIRALVAIAALGVFFNSSASNCAFVCVVMSCIRTQ